jgi:hypothetical protein
MSMDIILPFYALPSVTTVRINQASDESLAPSSQRYHTRDLLIINSNFGPEALINMLRYFSSLQKLYCRNSGGIVGYEAFPPRQFGRGIEHLKGCLEELTVLDYDSNSSSPIEEQEAINSLAGFKKLRKLAIDYPCLLRSDPEEDESNAEEDWCQKLRLVDMLPSLLELLAVSYYRPATLD